MCYQSVLASMSPGSGRHRWGWGLTVSHVELLEDRASRDGVNRIVRRGQMKAVPVCRAVAVDGSRNANR